MNSKYRIKKKTEFDEIIKCSKKTKNTFYTVYYHEKKFAYSRYGFAISKKYFNSVKRNKYKRIMREIVRTNINSFKNQFDYIIIMNRECTKLNYQEMENSLVQLIGGK